ncbi:hypothetical protein FOPG_09138 [Fusarium oxysporum f. sp. conglutinans race 2 54008]|uniref:Uncharacterized protein n=1 Tax=Fusarium oxysporum f. sp. conglutinans race 2 54008 TaxID=1089457 RepID=X0HHJ0_FUSOX|nr:hypothetical protein FOPG_09138 [Fusarium oxysporum f. sp. conglutinans race 2 54008]
MPSLMRWATQPVPTNECECEQGCQGFMLMFIVRGVPRLDLVSHAWRLVSLFAHETSKWRSFHKLDVPSICQDIPELR